MARWDRSELVARSRLQPGTEIVRKVSQGLLIPVDDEDVWPLLRDLHSLDIANLTPVQALLTLNEWQGILSRLG